MNPIAMMMQAMQLGLSPMQWLEQQSGENSQLKSLYEIVQGKTPEQLQETAANMAQQRGLQYEKLEQQIAQQMGVGIPKGQKGTQQGGRGARTPSHINPFFNQ